MADVLKAGKRGGYLPRVIQGRAWTGERHVRDVHHFTVSCAAGGEEYMLALTEDEMLETVAEWTTRLTRNRQQEKRLAKRS